jgi:hypothetical protein
MLYQPWHNAKSAILYQCGDEKGYDGKGNEKSGHCRPRGCRGVPARIFIQPEMRITLSRPVALVNPALTEFNLFRIRGAKVLVI